MPHYLPAFTASKLLVTERSQNNNSSSSSSINNYYYHTTASTGLKKELININPLPHGDANRHTIFKRKK